MQRRIVAALAALALGATACIGTTTAAAADELPGAPYVALGDSIAAGTGNQPYTDKACLRSAKAYPTVLSSMVGVPVVSAACSGATTQDVMGQVVALASMGKLGPGTRVVTITVGANDLGWQQVLLACSNAGSALACQVATAQLMAALQGLGPKIAAVEMAVRQAAPGALIAFTDYPLLFGEFSGMCSIGNYQGTPVKVTPQQAMATQQALIALAQVIQGTVFAIAQGGDSNVAFIDVAVGFAGHGLCDTGDRWISGIVPSGPMFARSLHPNTAGQKAYAMILEDGIGWAFQP